MNLSHKRPSALLLGLALLLIAAMVPVANAQGLTGLPFFGGSSGTCGTSCCEPCCPGGLKLDAGYLFGRRAVQFADTTDSGLFSSAQAHRWRHPLEGVQVGATLQAPLKDDFGVTLRGTWLFPSNGKARQEADTTAGVAGQDWSTKIQYYTVDGAAVYPFCAPMTFLAGFRFDSLSVTLKSPQSDDPFFLALPTDQTEVTLDSYIPYIGLGLNYGQALRLSLIGTPIYWGDVKFRRTLASTDSIEYKSNLKNNSYFMEVSGEYGLSVGPGTAAVLAKWTYMHGAGNATFSRRTDGIVLEQDPITTDLIRQQFYLGGSFAVALSSPF